MKGDEKPEHEYEHEHASPNMESSTQHVRQPVWLQVCPMVWHNWTWSRLSSRPAKLSLRCAVQSSLVYIAIMSHSCSPKRLFIRLSPAALLTRYFFLCSLCVLG